MKITNTTYNIKGINTKILLISDIHYISKKDIKLLNEVLDNIKKQKPKFICIPGDLTECSNIKDEEVLLNFLLKLSKISKVIISLGNHEFYYNKTKKEFKLNNNLIDKIKSIDNVYFLDNDNVVIDNINFIGLTLPITHFMFNKESYIDFKNNIKTIKTNKNFYNVLLCHSPVNVLNKEFINSNSLDLILCGHMHGGLVPSFLRKVFKTNGLVNPQKQLFPKNIYGYKKINNTNIIITSGIKVISNRKIFNKLNILFKPEVVCINIKNK